MLTCACEPPLKFKTHHTRLYELPVYYEEYDDEKHHVDKLPTTVMTVDGLEKCRIIGTDADRVKSFLIY